MRRSADSKTMNRSATRSVLAAVCLAGFVTLGCDQQDAASADLATVEHELAAVHPGGSVSAPPQRRVQVYTQSISRLQNVARTGTPAQQSAAQLLIARVEGGLAQIAAATAGELEQRLLDHATRLRASFDLSQASRSFAAALSAIDTSPQLATLDQTLAELDARTADAQSKRDDLQKDADRLGVQADAHMKDADIFKVQAGALRTQALDASASQSAEMSKGAYLLQRQASVEEVAAAELSARADKIRPLIAEQDLILTSLRDERSHLVDARRRIEEQTANSTQQAQSALADAKVAGEKAGEILDAIESIRTGELASVWSDAVGHASNAIGALSKARAMERSAAAISRGDAQQRLGEIHLAMAHSSERYLNLLAALEAGDPSSPLAGRFAEIHSRVKEDLSQSQQQIRDAMGQASSAYQGASVKDQSVRDRLGRITQSLAALSGEPVEIENDTPAPIAD